MMPITNELELPIERVKVSGPAVDALENRNDPMTEEQAKSLGYGIIDLDVTENDVMQTIGPSPADELEHLLLTTARQLRKQMSFSPSTFAEDLREMDKALEPFEVRP